MFFVNRSHLWVYGRIVVPREMSAGKAVTEQCAETLFLIHRSTNVIRNEAVYFTRSYLVRIKKNMI